MGIMFDDIMYVLCKEKEEMTSHLFLCYKISSRVWSMCDRLVEVSFVNG